MSLTVFLLPLLTTAVCPDRYGVAMLCVAWSNDFSAGCAYWTVMGAIKYLWFESRSYPRRRLRCVDAGGGPAVYDTKQIAQAESNLPYLKRTADSIFLGARIGGRFASSAYIERWTVKCMGGLSGGTIHIAGLSATATDVLGRLERLDGSKQITRLTPSSPSFVVEASPGRFEVVATCLRLGVEHILFGPISWIVT